jgi:TRAP-type C4-dicarboxylate transport system permease small subunit
MTSVIAKVDKGLEYVEKTIMVVAGIPLLFLLVFVVFARYFFHLSTPYEGELAKLLHIWMVFAGASWLVGREGHPGVEIFKSKIKKSSNIIGKRIYLTCMYVIMLLFIYPALIYGVKLMPLYIKQKTIYLGISYAFVYGGGILGMFFMTIRCFLQIAKIWKGEE